MARFNTEVTGTKTLNLAGGEAYSTNPKLELVSILLTSFVQDQFYRSANDTMDRVRDLLPVAGYEFGARAALYARREFGMRSITHVVGGEVAKHVKGATWTKDFFRALFKRPDDMLEVSAYYISRYGRRPFPNALKTAIRERLTQLDEYSLAKYRGSNRMVKMVDLVNLTHPKETEAIKKLCANTLRNVDTWETKLTQAGQAAETDDERQELKSAAWASLLTDGKLGYLAALRNVRNIVQQMSGTQNSLCRLLTNEHAIKKSLVFPFQIQTALEQALLANAPRNVVEALEEAMDLSLQNVPFLEGQTLVCVDDSASMRGKPIAIASIFAATLYRANDADLLMFNTDARFFRPRSGGVANIAEQIQSQAHMGGTDFKCIFNFLISNSVQRYERVIILSDMQSWGGYYSPESVFNRWCSVTAQRPKVFSFDLQGYGTLQFPERDVYCLAGFSPKVFDVMKLLEQDREALVHTIDGVSLVRN